MFRSNPLLWPKPPQIWGYGIAVLSVATALILTQWPPLHLEQAPLSLFVFAVMFAAWLGGVAPGLLATSLSILAFYYYFLSPTHSFAMKPEIPRFIAFSVSLLVVGLLTAAQRSATESLRRAHNHLQGMVQNLQRTNEALHAESSERKRAEEKLRQSEGYLSEAQRLSHTGSFGWRVSTGEIFWSEETYQIFQYDRTTKPTVDLVLRRTHPEDAAFVKQTIERASQGGKDFDFELRLLMPDGSIKHVHVVVHAATDVSGSVEFIGAVMDVTPAKQAEEALRRSEQQWRDVFENNPTMYFMIDGAGTVMAVNPFGAENLGYSVEELVGRPVLSVFYEPDREVGQENVANCLKRLGQSLSWELRKVRKDGSMFWVRETARAVLRGNDPVVLIACEDITERKRAEEKIREQEMELRQILDCTPLHVAVITPDRTPIYVNQAALDYQGLTPEQCRDAHGVSFFHPDDHERLISDHQTKFLRGHPYETEARLRRKDGKYRWFLFRLNPLRDEHGRITRWYLAGTDIEDRKQAEEALRQAQADLAHVSRVTTMGELTASLAHEVNQPIAAAVTNANTCLRWLTRDSPNLEEARAAAMRIVKDGTRAAEIISRVRLLFQKGPSQRELVDLNEVIREMIVLLRSETVRYDIAVGADLASDLSQVLGDRVQLQQVMMNLILNSIEAMKDVDGARELIMKSQRGDDKQLLVSISDTGVGLPAHQRDKIFNAFFTTKPHGTGMGLSISRSIVESHGGRLWFADNPPRGTSFFLALPITVEVHK